MFTINLLISDEQLKQLSPINDNVDWVLLRPVVLDVQNQYIHPLLGTGLYNELLGQISPDTLTTDNRALLETYLWPAMTRYIMAGSADTLLFKYMNKGIMKKSSDNSSPIDTDAMIKLAESWMNKAQWYAERATAFLCANSNTYPLYNNPGSTADTILPNSSNYTNGMYLEDDTMEWLDRAGIPSFSDREHYQRRR